MKTMIPLRVFGILTNIVFIVSSPSHRDLCDHLLHMCCCRSIPIACYQMLKLVQGVKSSLSEDLNMDWLKPFMTKRHCRKADVLFAKDASRR